MEAIIKGDDDRLLVIVGSVIRGSLGVSVLITRPCSVHNPEQAIEYCKQLLTYAKEAEDDLMIVMRVYFEKSSCRYTRLDFS